MNVNAQIVPWVPEVFSRERWGASFGGSFHRPQATRVRPKAEATSGEAFCAGHLKRLDRNRKPRMKSLWHPGYTNSGRGSGYLNYLYQKLLVP